MLVRSAVLLVLWVALIGPAPADLAAGVPTALAAAWASLRLLPRGPTRLRPSRLAALALRLAGAALVAGLDVARRALSPRLALRPGFVSHPLRLPPGPARDSFCALTSLLPGTVPSGCDERGVLLVHCLDAGPPVVAQLAADEARFAWALGDG